MLLRFTLSAAGAMVLAGSAFAQNATQAQPITSPVKDAGTFHLATGTWTRGVAPVALAGPEVIYDNTCTTGFYVGLPAGSENLDSGRVPSTTSPSSMTSLTGGADNYLVNGFTIAYCSFEPNVTTLGVAFYDCYAACDNAGAGYPTPATAAFAIANLPAGTATGSQGCWIVGFDLANTTLEFGLAGDCDGTYTNVASTDSFGWSWTDLAPTAASSAGPLLAGDPLAVFNASCGGVGGGTTFAGASAGPGTGIGNLDQFEAAGSLVGCFFFGGYSATSTNPYAGFYLQLERSFHPTHTQGTAYCFGDGSGALCPCAANGGPGEGCANTTGSGATLVASGNASITNDTFSMSIAGVPGAKPGLILRGANQVGGLDVGGDGLLCTTGQSARSQVQITSAGATTYTEFSPGQSFGATSYGAGAVTNYQFWYRDPTNTCSGGGFNFTNGWTVVWLP